MTLTHLRPVVPVILAFVSSLVALKPGTFENVGGHFLTVTVMGCGATGV